MEVKKDTQNYIEVLNIILIFSKIKIEIVLVDEKLEEAIKIIQNIANAEKLVMEKFFVFNVEKSIRIRTKEEEC